MSDADEEQVSGNVDAQLEDDVDDQVPADADGEKEGAEDGEDETGEGEASADSSDVSPYSYPTHATIMITFDLIDQHDTRWDWAWDSGSPSPSPMNMDGTDFVVFSAVTVKASRYFTPISTLYHVHSDFHATAGVCQSSGILSLVAGCTTQVNIAPRCCHTKQWHSLITGEASICLY